MQTVESPVSSRFISQAEYAKTLRPHLPAAAFAPDRSKLTILGINLAIMVLGWAIAAHLDRWPLYWLWLYLPLAIIMANSVMTIGIISHDFMHGSIWRSQRWNYAIGFLGFGFLWMPPTLWKNIHNRVHHTKTNSLADPDRGYLHAQGGWIRSFHDWVVPSNTITKLGLGVGMLTTWAIYVVRNLTAVVLFNRDDVSYVPASLTVTPRDRRQIIGEIFALAALHLGILGYLQFDPIKLLLAYFLPISLGYAGLMAYIYTQHMTSPLTDLNDPLLNTISLRLPKVIDQLHCNFSYHAEHHIFPGLNSDYYPQVRALLSEYYPERMGYILGGREAWHLLLTTPRHYQDATTLTDASGSQSVACHVNAPAMPAAAERAPSE